MGGEAGVNEQRPGDLHAEGEGHDDGEHAADLADVFLAQQVGQADAISQRHPARHEVGEEVGDGHDAQAAELDEPEQHPLAVGREGGGDIDRAQAGDADGAGGDKDGVRPADAGDGGVGRLEEQGAQDDERAEAQHQDEARGEGAVGEPVVFAQAAQGERGEQGELGAAEVEQGEGAGGEAGAEALDPAHDAAAERELEQDDAGEQRLELARAQVGHAARGDGEAGDLLHAEEQQDEVGGGGGEVARLGAEREAQHEAEKPEGEQAAEEEGDIQRARDEGARGGGGGAGAHGVGNPGYLASSLSDTEPVRACSTTVTRPSLKEIRMRSSTRGV